MAYFKTLAYVAHAYVPAPISYRYERHRVKEGVGQIAATVQAYIDFKDSGIRAR